MISPNSWYTYLLFCELCHKFQLRLQRYMYFFNWESSHPELNHDSLLKPIFHTINVRTTSQHNRKELSRVKQVLVCASSALKATYVLGSFALDIAIFISIVGLCFLFGLNLPTTDSHQSSVFKNRISQRQSVGTPRVLSHKTQIQKRKYPTADTISSHILSSNGLPDGETHRPGKEKSHAQNTPLPPQEAQGYQNNNFPSPKLKRDCWAGEQRQWDRH